MADKVALEPLPPREAVDFFRAKGFTVGFDHRDVWQDEHASGFTVAKAMRYDILADIRRAADSALADGKTFQQFRDELEPVLREKGWWGKAEQTDPKTGETRTVRLGSPRRLKTIYNVNLRTAQAAGRWRRIQRTKDRRPYLRYVAVLDNRTRPQHRAWHGTVLPVSHEFWTRYYPPNGWNCRCIAVQLSKRDLDRFGYAVTEKAPTTPPRSYLNPRTGERTQVPQGIDPGFAHNPGKASMRALAPPPRDDTPPVPVESPPVDVGDMPAPRRVPADRIISNPDDLSDAELAERFLSEFGASVGKPAVFTDKLGEPVVISERLFQTAAGTWKIRKQGRERMLPLLAEAIREPDEIWWIWEEHPDREGGKPARPTLTRRYLARFDVDGRTRNVFTLFDVGKDGWTGITMFDPTDRRLGRSRGGTLAYRRGGGTDGNGD